MKQKSLFSDSKTFYDDAFLIRTDCNRQAFEWLENWPKEVDILATHLIGPEKSGKKSMVSFWAEKHNALILCFSSSNYSLEMMLNIKQSVVVFPSETLSEEEEIFLFHLFNHIKEEKQRILFVSTKKIIPNLADLKSRIGTAHIIEISEPDEEMLTALYFKYFYSFGTRVSKDVVDFLILHFDRTYQMAYTLSKKINDFSVSEKKTITIPFIKNIFKR